MSANAALLYHPEGFDTSGARLMGRQAAGEGFLEALALYAPVEPLYCFAPSRDAFDDFTRRVTAVRTPARATVFLPHSHPEQLSKPGCLFNSGPTIGALAWQRRLVGDTAYSLCGLTHTLASSDAMDALAALVAAPLEPWDALICTSRAGKAVVGAFLEQEAAYLAERSGGQVRLRLELPVVPLGVHCDRFAAGDETARSRAAWRARLAIGVNDPVALFVGRLSFHAKASPAPMYLGLEAAAKAQPAGTRVHLILAGWFANAALERAFHDAARQLCPSVNVIVVDGRTPEARREIWHVADLFVSLSDNIQETFGLTPVEAMAAGLAVVASDWNGYRDTVVHGETGLLVPTLAAPSSAGFDLARGHATEQFSYDRYIGYASLGTVVDLRASAEALTRLIDDANLRRRMGEAGRARARTLFDWRVVIAGHFELWAELASRRAHATAERAPRPAWSRRPDPFALFASYPSEILSDAHRVSWQPDASLETLSMTAGLAMANFGGEILLNAEGCRALCAAIRARAVGEVGALLDDVPAGQRATTLRTLLWLAKFGLVRIDPPDKAERA